MLELFLPTQTGGFSQSTLPRSTRWDFEYNKVMTLAAEIHGFDFVRAASAEGGRFLPLSREFSRSLRFNGGLGSADVAHHHDFDSAHPLSGVRSFPVAEKMRRRCPAGLQLKFRKTLASRLEEE